MTLASYSPMLIVQLAVWYLLSVAIDNGKQIHTHDTVHTTHIPSPPIHPPSHTHTHTHTHAGRDCVLLGAHGRQFSAPRSPGLLDLQICRASWHSVHGTASQDSSNIIPPCVASQHNHPACRLGLHKVIHSRHCPHSSTQLCSSRSDVWLLCTDCIVSPARVYLEKANHPNANDPVFDSNSSRHLWLPLPWILYLFNFVWPGHAVSLF